jgi:hypothetical protein
MNPTEQRPPRYSPPARWEHKRAASIIALKAHWSIHAIVRAYEVPESVVRRWKEEAKIPPHKGLRTPRPMPEVGQILT